MLQKVNFLPGFNKQVTPTGAEGQWTGGDYIRFRYGTPEKLGGWDQLGEDKLTGAARALHHFDDNAGIKYAAIGTNRILYVYSGGQYHDIHPINNTITGCDFSTTDTETAVTLTFPTPHGMSEDDIVLLDTVTAPPAQGTPMQILKIKNLWQHPFLQRQLLQLRWTMLQQEPRPMWEAHELKLIIQSDLHQNLEDSDLVLVNGQEPHQVQQQQLW